MKIEDFPLLTMPDGSLHRVIPESLLGSLLNITKPKHFGNFIKALRVSKGWSQEDLGCQLGLKQSKISRIEGDSEEPDETLKNSLLHHLS